MEDPFNKDKAVSYGEAESVALGVRRITCPNPSPYTFTGTQSYLVGTGDVALIDPGPDNPAHLAAVMAALAPGERISHILVTHSHMDHSPGARTIARQTGAEVFAYGPHGSGLSPTMQALVESGAEIGGGSIRNSSPESLQFLLDAPYYSIAILFIACGLGFPFPEEPGLLIAGFLCFKT